MKPCILPRRSEVQTKSPHSYEAPVIRKSGRRPSNRTGSTRVEHPVQDLKVRGSKSQIGVACYDLHDQLVPYQQAWGWQQKLVAQMLQEEQNSPLGHLLILQHPPVLTLGAGSTERHLKFDPQDPPLPLFRTERGGEVTYHGPGQLVMYPILNLKHFTPDLHWFMRSLEEVVIRTLKEASGLEGTRSDGQTGVWVDNAKVAAIGIRARRWITYHGLALNVAVDLSPYQHIVPCGIADKPVTNVLQLSKHTSAVQQDQAKPLLDLYAETLIKSFELVFGAELFSSSLPTGIS